MPSVTDTTVPWLRMSADDAKALDAALDQFGNFCGIQLHDFSPVVRDGGGLRRSARPSFVRDGPCTEVSSTSSPTTTRMPPISSGSITHAGVELAAEALLQRRRPRRPAAPARSGRRCRSMASDTPELRVDQRVELRGDLRQRGQAAVVDHACAAGSSPASDSGALRAPTAISVEDLRGRRPSGCRRTAAAAALAGDGGQRVAACCGQAPRGRCRRP